MFPLKGGRFSSSSLRHVSNFVFTSLFGTRTEGGQHSLSPSLKPCRLAGSLAVSFTLPQQAQAALHSLVVLENTRKHMHGYHVVTAIIYSIYSSTCKSVTLSQPRCLRSAMSNNRAIAGCAASLALEAIERDVDGPSDLPVICGIGIRRAG